MATPARTPTDRLIAWAWWTAAAHLGEEERPGAPQCGFYRTKVRGQWRAAWIDIEQDIDPDTGELTGDERIRCIVDGADRNADDVWLWLDPITEAEFHRLQRMPVLPHGDLIKDIIT